MFDGTTFWRNKIARLRTSIFSAKIVGVALNEVVCNITLTFACSCDITESTI